MAIGILAAVCVLSVIARTALLASRPPRHKTPIFIIFFSAVFFCLSTLLGFALATAVSTNPQPLFLLAGTAIGASLGTLGYQTLFLVADPRSRTSRN